VKELFGEGRAKCPKRRAKNSEQAVASITHREAAVSLARELERSGI
jgi:hypothetical protein